jgi:hypothetical protein
MKHRHRYYWLAIAFVGVALPALAWASLNPVSFESRAKVYVIPKGTWAQRAAGKNIAILPDTIRLTLAIKDILVLRNDDDVPQMFGPVLIMPRQSFELPFRVASVYLFACTLHASGQLSVVVVPTPETPWARFWWRVMALTEPGPSA